MIISLLKHIWLELTRSPLLGRRIGQSVIMGFFGLYILLSLLAISGMGGMMIEQYYPERDIVRTGCAFILYFFIVSLIIRFLMQKYPGLQIKPYLLLPISKKKLVDHVLLRSVISYFNLLPFIAFLPFMFTSVKSSIPQDSFYGLLIFFSGVVILNHFLSFLIAKAEALNKNWIYGVLFLLIILMWADIKGWVPLLEILSSMTLFIIAQPYVAIAPWLLAFICIYFLRKALLAGFHLESNVTQQNLIGSDIEFPYLKKWGAVGSLLELELRLILRSKRARKYLFFSFLMMAYPLLFIGMEDNPPAYMYLFSALFMSGSFSLNHGLFLLAWNSPHFDLLLTRIKDDNALFSAKFYLLALTSIGSMFICLPYLLWSPRLYLYGLVVCLYMLSIVPAIYMLLANYNSKRLDPDQGGAMSFEGIGAAHWFSMIPIMGLPVLIFYLGSMIDGEWTGLGLIALIGLIGIIFHRSIISWNARIFQKRKYALASAFKEQI